MQSTIRDSLLLAGERELVALIDTGGHAAATVTGAAPPLLTRLWPHARAAPLRAVGVVASVFTAFFLLAVVGFFLEAQPGSAVLTALLMGLPSFLVARSAFASARRVASGPAAPVVSPADRMRVVEQRATRVEELLRSAPGPVTFEQIRDRLGWTHAALATAMYALIVRRRIVEDVDLDTAHLVYVLPGHGGEATRLDGAAAGVDASDPLAAQIASLRSSSELEQSVAPSLRGHSTR